MTTAKWTIGLRGFLWIAGLGLFVLLPLAFFVPAFFIPALGAMALAVLALFAAFLLHRRASTLAASHEKLSGEIDVLSQHLLKVEALASAAAARARPAAPVIAAPAAETEALAASVEEVTAEIGLLSGIVRELAAVVAAQDREIARLKDRPPDTRPERIRDPAVSSAPATPAPAVATVGRPVPPGRPSTLSRRAPSPAPLLSAPERRDPPREAALVEAFDGGGLEIWLQPLVTLPQRKVVSYEALARLRLGQDQGAEIGAEILLPDVFLPVLERHGRTTALDRRMLRSAATIARHLQGRGSQGAVVYGLSPLSLFEPDFLRSLGGLVGAGTDLSNALAVALPQASWRSLDAEQKTVLAELRGRIGFVLDRPTDLRFEAAALAERGIAQVKVPAALLLRPSAEAQPDIAVEDLVTALGRSGIGLAVCDVEHEADVPNLIDLDVPLAQGEVFASPRAVRPEVFVAAPDAPDTPEPPSQPDPEPPPRRNFRDFLRRAV